MKYTLFEGTSPNISQRPQSDLLTLCYCRNYLMLVWCNSVKGPSQEWQNSQAAGQVNKIRRELQEAFNREEVRKFDSL